MSIIVALSLGIAAAQPIAPIEHSTRVEHGGGVVDAHYRTQVSLVSRQVGSVTKPGTPSTLRCAWRANVRVEREAQYGANVRLARGFDRAGVLDGSRSGWCSTHRDAIAQEVAQRTDEIQAHLAAAAQEDETVLRTEIERVNASRSG